MSLVAATPGVGCTTAVNDSLCLFMSENVELDTIDDIHQTLSQNGGLRDEFAVAAKKLFSPQHRRLLYNSAQGHLGLNSLMALTNNGLNHNHSDDTSLVSKVTHRTSLSHNNHSYVGLPYQDHNYVAPFPCSPPQSPVVTLNSSSKFTGFNSSIHHGNISNCSTGHLPPTVASGLDDLEYHAAANGVGVREIVVTTTVPVNGSTLQDTSNGDDSVTRCICDFQHDDGYMICCDQCGVWQHVDCMRVDRENIPDSYLCEVCEPRSVDKHRAIQIQTRKRDDLSLLAIDSSATETEDETTQDDMVMYPSRKKIRRDSDDSVKRRVKRTLKDESPKKKAHFKARNNGLMDSKVLSSPQKPLISQLQNADRDDMHTVFGVGHIANATEALFAAVDCVTSYCDATINSYSPELQALLPNIRFNGQHASGNSHRPFSVGCAEIDAQLADRQPCHFAQVAGGKKMGLEATEDIITNQPLIEFVGKVMLRDQYDSEVNSLISVQPYVLFYTKLEGLDLCVDARQYGNEARFVRRSCTPNAEVRHVLDGHSLRFFLHATKSIIRGAEITIPFDINYHKCSYLVECACTRMSCPVVKYQTRELSGAGLRRHRLAKSVDAKPVSLQLSLDTTVVSSSPATPMKTVPPSPATVSSKQKRPPPLNITAANGPSVNGLVVSTVSTDCIDVHVSASTKSAPSLSASPSKSTRQNLSTTNHIASNSSVPVTTDVEHPAMQSGHSDNDASDKSKKKTREEKKLEAILKTIEKMEKREERKKEALARLDSSKKLNCKDKESKPSDSDQSSANVPVVKDQKKSASSDEDKRPQPTKSKKSRQHIATSNRRASVSVVSTSATSNTATVTPSSHTVVTAVSKSPQSTASIAGSDASQPPLVISASKVSPEITSGSITPVAVSVTTASAAPSAEPVKLPKKLLMRDRGGQRNLVMRSTSDISDIHQPLTVQTDCSNDTSVNGNDLSEFMPCRPSPHSHTLSSLRRLSVPACGQSKITTSLGQNCANGGSAKKRWLQKAMHENTTESSSLSFGAAAIMSLSAHGTCCVSSVVSALSPSAGDFVTPLKKRRLARESLSMDDSLPGVSEEDTCGSTAAPVVSPVGIVTHPSGELAQPSVGMVTGGCSTAELFSDGTVSEASLDSHDENWSKYVRRKPENEASVTMTSLPTTFGHWQMTAASNSLNQAARTLSSSTSEQKSDISADEGQSPAHAPEKQYLNSVSDSNLSTSSVKVEPCVTEAVSLQMFSQQVTESAAKLCMPVTGLVATKPVNCFQMVGTPEQSVKAEKLSNCDSYAAEGIKQQNEEQRSCNLQPVSEYSVVVSCNARLAYSGTNEGHQTTTSLGDLISRIERRPLSHVPVDIGLGYHKFSSVEDGSLLSKSHNFWTVDESHETKLSSVGSVTVPYLLAENPASSPGKNWYESVCHTSGDALVPSVLEGLAIRKPESELLGWTAESSLDIKNLSADQTKTLGMPVVHPVQSQLSELYLSPSQTVTSCGQQDCDDKNYSSDGSRLADCSSDSEHGDRLLTSTPVVAPALAKKKVSLLEYRQRKSQRSGDTNAELHVVYNTESTALSADESTVDVKVDPDEAKTCSKSSILCHHTDDNGPSTVVLAAESSQHVISVSTEALQISENPPPSPVISDLTVSSNQEHLNSLTDRDATR